MPIARPSLPELSDYVARLEDIWESHMLSNFGKHAQEFEHKAQTYLGNPYVRAVSSCDVGLIIALRALELPPGFQCIVPSFTFNSTVNAILWNRLRPVFCDIDGDSLNADHSDIESRISDKVTAILCTHVFGNPCDIDRIREIALRHGLKLVFDCAHAYGSMYKGRKVGTFGDLEVFSFSGTKLVTCAEGGLIATTDADIFERIKYIRGYGFFEDYDSRYLGINGKISELNAALGCLTIDTVEDAVNRRQSIVKRYRENLADIPEVSFQKVKGDDRSTYKDFAILCQYGRDELEAILSQRGIQTKRYFYPVHRMHYFRDYSREKLPVTEQVYDKILCLPIYNEMDNASIDLVCDIVCEFFK